MDKQKMSQNESSDQLDLREPFTHEWTDAEIEEYESWREHHNRDLISHH